MVKALGLLSGGLDSRLAIKLIQEQGINVEALHFKLPFKGCCLPDCAFKFTQVEKTRLHIIDATKGKVFQDYIKIIKKPKHGYGVGMNPCIDCRIFMLKKAKRLAKKINAKFIFTGEVLGERPMSQNKKAMELIETEVRLKGKLLRPLSAKLLPETEAEKKGWVDRKKLLSISGRRRNLQFDLAKRFKLRNFPNPAGGCILCAKEFAAKLKDLLKNKKRIKPIDIEILKLGRHFRYGKNKIIVGRNEMENKMLLELKQKTDYMFEAPYWGSPITILEGPKTRKAIMLAARLTARYSDSEDEKTLIKYGKKKLAKSVTVSPIRMDRIESIRV